MIQRIFLLLLASIFVSCSVPSDEAMEDAAGTQDTPVTEEPEEPEESEKPQDQPVAEPEDDGVLRILAIGNSFSQDAVEQYLYELFDAAGQKAVIGNLYIGGCTLETHHANMLSGEGKYKYRKIADGVKTETEAVSLLAGLEDEPWDLVSVQQASGKSGQYDTYSPYLPELLEYVIDNVDNESLALAFHQTWAYSSDSDHGEFPKYQSSQTVMYESIMSAVAQAMKDNPSLEVLIPSGTAIQNGRTSFLGDTFNRDGYHLETTYGRYTAACTWYESISGNSVVGNTYAPETIDSYTKEIAQHAAHYAVLQPWKVTEMTDYSHPPFASAGLESPIHLDFGGGSLTPPAPWVRISSYSLEGPLYLKDAQGGYAPVYISSMEGFTGTHNGTGAEPSDSLCIDGTDYPKSVWSDALMVGGTKGEGDVGPAVLVFAGLEPDRTYDMRVIAVRFNGSADARISSYTVSGKDVSEPQTIYPGLKTLDSVESYDGYGIIFEDIKPSSSGELSLSVTGKDTSKAAEGHINAIILSRND